MNEIDDAKLALSQIGWLCQTSPAFRQAVLGRSMLRWFGKNEELYHIGDDAGGLWGLAEGGLAIETAGGERNPAFIHYALPGFWTGEYSVITGQPRSIGMRATRPSTLLYLSRTAFLEIAADDPQAWRWVALLSSQHIGVSIGYMLDLSIRSAERRVVSILLRMACQHEDNDGVTGPLPADIDISHETLGEFSNVSRAALSEILRSLADDGAIELGYRRLAVLSAESLWARLARTV